MAHDAVDILWEGQAGHQHVMTIGNAGSQHRGECSWWAQGPGCLEQIQEWQQWVQHCHLSSDSEVSECVTFADGKISVRIEGGQQLKKGQQLPQHAEEKPEDRSRKACPFTECKTWHGLPGVLEVVYFQVKRLLDWEALALITQVSGRGSINGNTAGEQEVQTTKHAQTLKGLQQKERQRGTLPSTVTQKVILGQGPWCDEESTMAWERYMQTEGRSQHVCCQHCDSTEKPIAVVTPGRMEQRRQLVCFCTNCWSFTSRHHSKDAPMDISFFKQFNPNTGKFHRALPYAEEHPRRIRGPVTDYELDQFRKDRLKPRKAGGPDRSNNELFRSLTAEELPVL
jgi:hypothetical protein